MEMSSALQYAVFAASIAVIVLVICVVPVVFHLWRSIIHLTVKTERLETNAQMLLEESRELVRNAGNLSERTNQYLEEVGKVMLTVQHWTEKTNRLISQIGLIVDPSVLALVRNSKMLRVGATAFLRALLHPNRREPSKNQNTSTKER